jgi:hypothetical protein
MGQSILSDRKTPFRERAFILECCVYSLWLSKGNQVNIPEPGHGDKPLSGG